MRRLKKLATLLTAVIMVMSLAAPAYAAYDPDAQSTITFTTVGGNRVSLLAASATATNTLYGYKLLTLTTSLKAGDTCGGGSHSETCYNYAYYVNPKYENCMLDAANGMIGDDDDDITSLTLISFIGGLSSTDAQTFADEVYRNILDADLEADVEDIATSPTTSIEVDKGYWLFADVTSYSGVDNINSVVLLETKGDETLTVTPKQDVPTLTKYVSDTDKNLGAITTSCVDAQVGDTVYFEITATISNYLASYEEYPMNIIDSMATGLEYQDDLTVYIVDSSDNSADISEIFTIEAGDYTSGSATDITVSCDDLIQNIPTLSSDMKIIVRYSAKVTSDVDTNYTGNVNSAYLEYLGNPYETSIRSTLNRTTTQNAYVYSYGIQMTKVNGDDDAEVLTGAEFRIYYTTSSAKTMYAQVSGGAITGWAEATQSSGSTVYPANSTVAVDSNGVLHVTGFDSDVTYYIEETKAPEGFVKLNDPVEITMDSEYSSTGVSSLEADIAIGDDENTIEGNYITGIVPFKLGNYAGAELPITGGNGVYVLYTAGGIIIAAAAFTLVNKKKKASVK